MFQESNFIYLSIWYHVLVILCQSFIYLFILLFPFLLILPTSHLSYNFSCVIYSQTQWNEIECSNLCVIRKIWTFEEQDDDGKKCMWKLEKKERQVRRRGIYICEKNKRKEEETQKNYLLQIQICTIMKSFLFSSSIPVKTTKHFTRVMMKIEWKFLFLSIDVWDLCFVCGWVVLTLLVWLRSRDNICQHFSCYLVNLLHHIRLCLNI
jgi:hypothetical protein